MTFLERATPYAKMGIPVFPLRPKEKKPIASLTNWPDLATTDLEQIDKWNAENPDYNCGLVAKPDGVVFWEFDIANGTRDAAKEMGQRIPETRRHISGGGFAHNLFLQTDRSRALGNRQANLPDQCTNPKCEKADKAHSHEWFSFRQNNRYVVGPGSIHPNGFEYGVARDILPVPCPDWVCDFVEKHTEGRTETKDARPISEDFDFYNLMDWYGLEVIDIDGAWHTTSVCPVAGYRHEHSQATGFYWDDESIGFHCFAQGCEGSSMSIGKLLRFLNQEHDPFPEQIWEEQELDMSLFGDNDLDPIVPESRPIVDLTSVFPNAKEVIPEQICQAPLFSGCTCTNTHAYRQVSREDEIKAEHAEEDAAAVISEEKPAGETIKGEFVITEGMVKKEPWRMVGRLMSDIPMLQQKWLWPSIIPEGEITLFSGSVARGKSLAALNLIACITTGSAFPDGASNTMGPRQVMIAATEDRYETVIKPRLKALSADMTRIIVLERVVTGEDKKKSHKLELKKDTELLNQALKQHPDVALVVLDPITGFYGGVDGNDNKEIRPILENMAKVCHMRNVTFVVIVHENKQKDVGAVNQILGAGALSQVVRSGYRFSNDTDPESKGGKIMASIKSNLTKEGGGLRFSIDGCDVTVDDGTSTNVPIILWGDKHDLTADDVMAEAGDAAVERKKSGRPEKRTETKSLIQEACAKGPCRSSEVYTLAEMKGISEITLKRVKQEMVTGGELEYKKDSAGHWWMRMPEFLGTESQQKWWSMKTPDEDAVFPEMPA